MEWRFEIRLLGHFSVRCNGEEVPVGTFGGRLARSLVRMLLVSRGQFVSIDQLADALWGERLPADPPANLAVLVNRARRALGDPSLIRTLPGGYAFSQDERCLVDAEAFVAAVDAGRRSLAAGQAGPALREFEAALALWRGEPLAEDLYEDWAQDYRGRVGRAYLEALEGAAESALAVGDPRHAVARAEQAVSREPLREESHRLLIRALAAAGEAVAAQAAFDAWRRQLADELGVDPSPETIELRNRIARGEAVDRPGPRRWVRSSAPAVGELPFVGRERELRAILRAVDVGGWAAAVVSGSSGMGKSRLLAEVSASSSVPVLTARAFAAEQEEAWALARSVLREAITLAPDAVVAMPDRAAHALADVIPEIEDLRPITGPAAAPESRRALALEGGTRVMEAAASEGGLVVVDDLQWADATSLAFLGLVLRRVPRLGAVLAYRVEELDPDGPVFAFLAQLRDLEPEPVWVALEALSADAIGELLEPELVRSAVEETDRTPLALTELVRSLAVEGAIERAASGRWRPRTPEAAQLARRTAAAGQRRGIQRRVDRQPSSRRQLMGLLALSRREVPARLLSEATGTTETAVLDDLDALSRAALARLGAGGWATAHDLVAEAVADALPGSHRGRLHQMLATAIEAVGGERAEAALHLAAAGDRGAAAVAYLDASRQSLERYSNEEAEWLSDAGLQLQPQPGVRTSLLEVRGEARARLDKLPAAVEDLRAVLATTTRGPDRARVLARVATLTSGIEGYGRASEVAELALAEAGREPGARAEALAVAAMVDMNRGLRDRAEARAAEAVALFEELGDTRGRARAVEARGMTAMAGGRIAEATDLLGDAARLFRDSGELLRVGTPSTFRAWGLVLMGRAEEARCGLEEVVDLERTLGHAKGEALALLVMALAHCALDRPEEGRAAIEEALAMIRPVEDREALAAGLVAQGIADEASGRMAEAARAFREALETARDMPIISCWAEARLATVLVAQGDLAGAESHLERVDREGAPFNQYEARWARAELAAARGDRDAALVAAEALRLAEAGGHLLSAARLRQLLGPHLVGEPPPLPNRNPGSGC